MIEEEVVQQEEVTGIYHPKGSYKVYDAKVVNTIIGGTVTLSVCRDLDTDDYFEAANVQVVDEVTETRHEERYFVPGETADLVEYPLEEEEEGEADVEEADDDELLTDPDLDDDD